MMFVIRNSFRALFIRLSVISCFCISPCSLVKEVLAEEVLVNDKKENKLNPVVVTATRTAQTADETLASVSIITREDIERSQSQDIFGLLRAQAGIDVVRTGGSGNSTNVFMRGTNSDHILVLIDGVRAASATLGTFAFHTMDVSQIERIEIVRGPRASLYGSDAIGGVIQIFTRKFSGATARVEGGSFGTKIVNVGYGGGEKIKYNFNLNIKDIKGFSSTNKNVAFGLFNPDNDSFKANSVTFGLKLPVLDKLTLKLNTWYNSSESEFDDGLLTDDVIDDTNKTVSLGFEYANNDAWTQEFNIGYAADDSKTSGNFPSTFTTERNTIDWQNNFALASEHLITAGFNYYEDNAKSIDNLNTLVFDKKIHNNAIYTNWQTEFSKNDFQLGLRYDDHSEFGSESTGQIAWGMKIDKVKVRASYATAFKAPNFNELFHPGFGGLFAGNPSLQPETSESFEIGANHIFSKTQKLDVSIFKTSITDLIAYQGTNFQAINIADASIRGLELAYTLKSALWAFHNNITIQKSTNDVDNSPLLRRADRKLGINISRTIFNTGNLTAGILFSSDRTDIGDTLLPGYGILNFSANYPINKQLILQGRIENVSDKQYELASGFNTADRSVFIALRYQD